MPISNQVHDIPPRRFELTSCNGRAGSAGVGTTWLDLALTERADVWPDRASEMKALRAQSETLVAIAKRFGLRAERVARYSTRISTSEAGSTDRHPGGRARPMQKPAPWAASAGRRLFVPRRPSQIAEGLLIHSLWSAPRRPTPVPSIVGPGTCNLRHLPYYGIGLI